MATDLFDEELLDEIKRWVIKLLLLLEIEQMNLFSTISKRSAMVGSI